MNLAKAGEIIKDIRHMRSSVLLPDSQDALKIADQAIDRLQELRAHPRLYPIEPLPSETE